MCSSNVGDRVGNRVVGDWVGNSMVGNSMSSMNHRGMVGRCRGMVGRCRGVIGRCGGVVCRFYNCMRYRVGSRSVRIDGLTRVGDLSNITVDVVGVVVNRLDPSVGKIHRVGSLDEAGAIVAFLLAKGCLGVVISNSIGVTVRMVAGRGVIGRCRGMVGRSGGVICRLGNCRSKVGRSRHFLCWGKICWGWVGNNNWSRGNVGGGGLGNGLRRGVVEGGKCGGWGEVGVVHHRLCWGLVQGGHCWCWCNVGWGSMDHRCCMDSMGDWVDTMCNGMVGKSRDGVDGMGCQRNNGSVANRDDTVGAHRGLLDLDETLGVVCLADRGVGGTKSLRLNQASLLTVGSGHCLVGGLPTNCMVGKSMVSEAMVCKAMMTHKKGRLSCNPIECCS